MFLLQGPGGGLFLMSEVLLYCRPVYIALRRSEGGGAAPDERGTLYLRILVHLVMYDSGQVPLEQLLLLRYP